jgi:hypothetical protein
MGLINKLQKGESTLTPYNGNTPQVNQLATAQSPLHDSYSITGQNAGGVNNLYQQYLDGTNNTLPTPSNLDLGGATPTISPNGQSLPYLNNLPG